MNVGGRREALSLSLARLPYSRLRTARAGPAGGVPTQQHRRPAVSGRASGGLLLLQAVSEDRLPVPGALSFGCRGTGTARGLPSLTCHFARTLGFLTSAARMQSAAPYAQSLPPCGREPQPPSPVA